MDFYSHNWSNENKGLLSLFFLPIYKCQWVSEFEYSVFEILLELVFLDGWLSKQLTMFSMFFNSDEHDEDSLNFSCEADFGDIEFGRAGDVLDEAQIGNGLELLDPSSWILISLSQFFIFIEFEFELFILDVGVTASNADPMLPGKLYGAKRLPFRFCNEYAADEWPE